MQQTHEQRLKGSNALHPAHILLVVVCVSIVCDRLGRVKKAKT